MVLVYAENQKGKFKKNTFEAVTYGKKLAEKLGKDCVALVLGNVTDDPSGLGVYGASKVYHINDAALSQFDSQVFTNVIAQMVEKTGAEAVILNHSSTGKSLLGRLSVKLNAGSVSGVNQLPSTDGGFKVRKNVFSGKAIAEFQIFSPIKLISLMGNSMAPSATGASAPVENPEVQIPERKITIKELKTIDGKVPLPEAELVVSAGRGMKGPENWGIVEDLAETVGATLACSRPVADTGWRPHHEHVGQTGVAIRPNLYIAIGISGAIQHLAGVNSSKVIVVINKDPEAPFFKAADYGVCGDLFEVVPKLRDAFKKFKSSN